MSSIPTGSDPLAEAMLRSGLTSADPYQQYLQSYYQYPAYLNYASNAPFYSYPAHQSYPFYQYFPYHTYDPSFFPQPSTSLHQPNSSESQINNIIAPTVNSSSIIQTSHESSKKRSKNKSLTKPKNQSPKYLCSAPSCQYSANNKRLYRQHLKSHSDEQYHCNECRKTFMGAKAIQNHIRSHSKNYSCKFCPDKFHNWYQLKKHLSSNHPQDTNRYFNQQGGSFKQKTALKGKVKTYTVKLNVDYDPDLILCDKDLNELEEIIKMNLKELGGVKFMINCDILYNRISDENDIAPTPGSLRSQMQEVNDVSQIEPAIRRAIHQVASQDHRPGEHGSCWVIKEVERIVLRLVQYKPSVGGCMSYGLPPSLQKKQKSLVGIKTDDNKCFYWCIAASDFLRVEGLPEGQRSLTDPRDCEKYRPYFDALMNELTSNHMTPDSPVSVSQAAGIAKRLGRSINIYRWSDENRLAPLSVCKDANERATFMLHYEGHYYWITTLKSFLQVTGIKTPFWCNRCLSGHMTSAKLAKHQEICGDEFPQHVKMPDEDKMTFDFRHIGHMMRAPIVIYADFESTLDKSDATNERFLDTHVPNSYGLVVLSSSREVIYKCVEFSDPPNQHDGKNAARKFLLKLKYLYKNLIKDFIGFNMPLSMSNDDEIAYENATDCHICQKTLFQKYAVYGSDEMYQHTLCSNCSTESEKSKAVLKFVSLEQYESYKQKTTCDKCNGPFTQLDKVIDHDHVTGKYRGAAHRNCNLNLKFEGAVSVFFHNLKGYDGHHIIQQLDGSIFKTTRVLAENYVKYKAIYLDNEFILKDSMAFMMGSLDKLVNMHMKTNPNLTIMEQVFAVGEDNLVDNTLTCHVSRENYVNIQRKGEYPYEWIDDLSKMDLEEFPPIEAFHSTLREQKCSQQVYEEAKNMYSQLGCKKFRDYHVNYLWRDVALLAEVFENFRDKSLSAYRLDPAHYFSAPGLAMDAALLDINKYFDDFHACNVNQSFCSRPERIQLIGSLEDHDLIDRGFYGGQSVIVKRNDKFIKSTETDKGRQLLYIDANNLYGFVMCNPLPFGHFRLYSSDNAADQVNIAKWEEVMSIGSQKDAGSHFGFAIGAFLEVDLSYPPEIHDLHNDFPLAVVHGCADDQELSEFQRQMLGNKKRTKSKKLLGTLYPRNNYVIHHEHLKMCIKQGLILDKIHRVLEFSEAPFLKSYIEKNNERRANATSPFEKDFYKLMNNSVYGKLCENVRSRKKVTLVHQHNERLLEMRVRCPQLQWVEIINEDTVLTGQIEEQVTLNKPKFIGAAVLNLAKRHMSSIHYDYIVKHDLKVNPPSHPYDKNGRLDMSTVVVGDSKNYGPVHRGWSLLFHDTDSFCYAVDSYNLHEEIASSPELMSIMDLSNYPDTVSSDERDEWHPYESAACNLKSIRVKSNDSSLGFMKDELKGGHLIHWIGLRAKMYAMQTLQLSSPSPTSDVTMKAKGVPTYALKKSVNFEDYVKVQQLFIDSTKVTFSTIRSDNQHQVHTTKVNKIALSAFDDKRHVLPDGNHTLAFGHWRLGSL